MSIILGFAPLSRPARLAVKPERLLGYGQLQRKLNPSRRGRSDVVRRSLGTQSRTPIDGRAIAYTWLTHTPEQITPDDVLSSLPSAPHSLAQSGTIPVLLVTPSFAHWVDASHNLFLEQYINRLYCDAPGSNTNGLAHALVAIVDRLPDTRVKLDDDALDSQNVSDSEGISVLFAKQENILGKAAAPRKIRATDAEESALVFSVQADSPKKATEGTHGPTHEVGLRLANTIFINGKENTLFGTRWTYDSTSSKYNLDQSVGISRCIVAFAANSVHSSFDFPLHPVGQRRRVITSMGNILRQLTKHPDEKSSEPMPASHELEKELPRYIAEHDIADHRVSVWALVETPEMNIADSSPTSPHKTIQAGGKLHHVMSGGGGWGKKQGLLSLDPEITFLEPASNGELVGLSNLFSPVTATPPQIELPSFDKGAFIDDLSSLSQVARAGDYIQFFVSVSPKKTDRDPAELLNPERSLSCHFGVVSDAETPMAQSHGLSQKDLTLIPNHFGALSEKAITYSQPVIPQLEGETRETVTKSNIPGSRVELVLE